MSDNTIVEIKVRKGLLAELKELHGPAALVEDSVLEMLLQESFFAPTIREKIVQAILNGETFEFTVRVKEVPASFEELLGGKND